jgi:hypothetical protein
MVLAVGSIALVASLPPTIFELANSITTWTKQQHAVIGLFVADALRDLPIRHPVQYA